MKKNKKQRREQRINRKKAKQMKWKANKYNTSNGDKNMNNNGNGFASVIRKAFELTMAQGIVPPLQVVDAACWQVLLKQSMSKVPQHIFNMDVSDHFSNGHFFYSRLDREKNGGELTLIENDLFLACHDIAACSIRTSYPQEHHYRFGYDQDRNCVVVILMDRHEVNNRFDIALFFKPEDIADYKEAMESIVPGKKPFTASDYSSIHPQMHEWKSLFDALIQ